MIFLNLKKIIAGKPRILNLLRLGRGFAPSPLFYLVHLTLNCNASCPFCYQKDLNFGATTGDFLKIDDFEKILKQAQNFIFKRPLIHLFGGEPLLHPQFPEFLSLTREYRYPCALTTNGILLGKYLEKISAAGNLRQINVSLYGVGELHDRIVGRSGAFEDVISNIKRIQEPGWRKKIVNINCVINDGNFDKLAILASFLDRYFNNREISALVFQYPVQKEICLKIDSALFKVETDKIKKMKCNFKIYFVSKGWFDRRQQTSSPDYLRGKCNLPWVGLGILPNLDVVAGGSILTCSRSLGNLKKETLREIWKGRKLGDLRKRVSKWGLPFSCWGCCHGQLS